MSESETMTGCDLFARYTATNGSRHVAQHRVWSIERFVAARRSDALALNADALARDPKAQALAAFELVDRATFDRDRGAH